MAIPDPVIGAWYEQFRGQLFRVVAMDDDDDTVEVQYFDGTIEELSRDDWPDLLLTSAAAPEDWSGSVDMDFDDAGPEGVLEDVGLHRFRVARHPASEEPEFWE